MNATRNPEPLDLYPNFEQRLRDKRGLKRLLLTALPFIPRHAYVPFLDEARVALHRLRERYSRTRKRYKGRSGLIINVGCGPSGKPGWINIDVFRFPGVNCVYDCRKHLPFDDNSVRYIFSEHFFEHVDYCEEVPFFLSDCYRVLQPGGVIRIIVPDTEKYIRAYCREGWDELARIRPLGPERSDAYFGSTYNTKMELLNVVFRQYFGHKFAYDFATLEFLLRRYGFSQVQRQSFGRSLWPDLCIDTREREFESLYVEAVK